MNQVLLTAILGLGAGAAFGILASGIVVIYRGSGIINFGQGGIAAFGAFCFISLVNAGVQKHLAMAIVLVGAAVGGVLFSFVMKPLRNAPVLARVVATISLLAAFPAAIVLIWGDKVTITVSVLPSSQVHMLGGSFGSDRFLLLAIAVLLGVGLWFIYGYTSFGLTTRAAAENEKGAALIGYSPHFIASVNWALGWTLAALAGILIAPLASLDPQVLALLVIPALAAALLGRLTSFGITIAVGMAIGIAQSELSAYWAQPGISTAAPFVAVILATVLAGKSLPIRGTLSEGRPPLSLSGRMRPVPILIAAGAVAVMIVTFNDVYLSALTITLVMAIISLSVVIITGYVGQISLMQMTFAAIGGFMAAKFATDAGFPFPLAVIAGGLTTVPVGIVLGLPALRVRGVMLAVVTLGAAVTAERAVFQNKDWIPDVGMTPPEPKLGSFSLEPFAHPERFAIATAIALAIMMVLASNLRRGVLGREMLAVRSSERAAAAGGISVSRTKLQAFAISAFIAGVGGAMYGYFLGTMTSAPFQPIASITVVMLTYIGGIATVSGALLAGIIASGGLIYQVLASIGAVGKYYVLVSSIAVIWTVIVQPDGGTVLMRENWLQMKARFSKSSRPSAASSAEDAVGPSATT